MTNMTEEICDYVFDILIAGCEKVGKTQIINRYVYDNFESYDKFEPSHKRRNESGKLSYYYTVGYDTYLWLSCMYFITTVIALYNMKFAIIIIDF